MIGIAAGITIQIEIRMVRHIDNSRLIRFCLVADIDSVIIRQCHQYLASDIAGKTFFSILRKIGELEFLRTSLPGIIYLILKTVRPPMQTVTVIITR